MRNRVQEKIYYICIKLFLSNNYRLQMRHQKNDNKNNSSLTNNVRDGGKYKNDLTFTDDCSENHNMNPCTVEKKIICLKNMDLTS